jgi:hypothetical protein
MIRRRTGSGRPNEKQGSIERTGRVESNCGQDTHRNKKEETSEKSIGCLKCFALTMYVGFKPSEHFKSL